MDTLNIISVSETATRELRATGARLVVRISGQSFFAGNEAFRKATEVASCIASLAKCSIPEDDIRLLNVAAEVESGFLSKSSSAIYDLEVKCRSIDLLGPVIAAISSQKNSKISSIAWVYHELAKMQKDVLQDAVRAAHLSATAIADALNVSLSGVHRLSYNVTGLDTDLQIPGKSFARSRAANDFVTGLPDLSSGLMFSHTTQIAVAVKADFIIGKSTDST